MIFFSFFKKGKMLISFTDVESDTFYWKVNANIEIFDLLKLEIKEYNNWIEKLDNGLAPLSSYVYPNDADDLYLAKRKHYHNILERPSNRGVYESLRGNYWFNVYKITNPDEQDEDGDPDLMDDINDGKIKFEHVTTLIDFITKTYDSYDAFSMGFRLLPMTRYLVENNLINN
jgi:hypothetical protein